MRTKHDQRCKRSTICALATLLSISATHAQETGGAAAAAGGLEEVLVTAQRRAERIQDVPLSVTNASVEQLERIGVTEIRDLALVTSNVKFDAIGVWTQPSIRGISSSITGPGAEANVAIYLDGVYQPSQLANTFELPDVDRIEILKGPQGTLFGRNATGGAIRIFTRDPSDPPGGKLTASYGRFNDMVLKGYVNGPLSDTVSASLSASYQENDGYYHDIVKDKDVGKVDSTFVRGKLKMTPTEDLTLSLNAFYMDRHDEASTQNFPLNQNSLGRLFDPTVVLPTKPYDVAQNEDAFINVKSYGADLGAEFRTSYGAVNSTLNYSRRKSSVMDSDGDFSPDPVAAFILIVPSKTWTFETIFSSEKQGRFQYIAGAFLYRDDAQFDPQQVSGLAVPGAPLRILIDNEVRSESAFGEVSFDVNERLTAIAGVRYTTEKREYSGSSTAAGALAVPPGKKAEADFSKVTPRVSLRYALNEASSLYATWSKGFKSGVLNASQFATEPVDPEEVTAYEIGYKTANSMFALNTAAFY